jgi:hypothetical protein
MIDAFNIQQLDNITLYSIHSNHDQREAELQIRIPTLIRVQFGLEDPDSKRDPCSNRVGGSGFRYGSVFNSGCRIEIPKGILVQFGLEDPDSERIRVQFVLEDPDSERDPC